MFEIKEKRDFFTINKKEFSFASQKMVNRTYRLYAGACFPPTSDYIYPKGNKNTLPPRKTLNLEQKELPEEVKVRFAENIIIQDEVMRIVKKRAEQFNYRCWLIRLTTWKGKSHIILNIAEYYQTNTLVLVHNVKTLQEMHQKFKEYTNIEPWIYWGWKKEIKNITIMTKRSFVMDYEKIDNFFWLVLIDEAPIGFSKKFWSALDVYFHWKESIGLYGLSWTPQKNDLDTEDLEKYFGKILEVKGQKNNGYNIIPKFTMLDYYTDEHYEFEGPAELRTAISENEERLSLQMTTIYEYLEGRKCLLVLSDRKYEIENYYNELEQDPNRDFNLIVMTGDTKVKDDDENLEKAKSNWKQTIILGTIQKIGVGVDIPIIDTVLLLSAIKFRSTVIQAIWRGLRKCEGKTDVIVWIWNDLPILKKQRAEKIKTICKEYWLEKNNINSVNL